MSTVFLSRRNLTVLLSKLDRVKAGEFSVCTLIKRDNVHAKYPQTMVECAVTAMEDGPKPPQGDPQIFLTRSELNTLLGGLDALLGHKYQGILIELQPHEADGSLRPVNVRAVEDKEYYSTRNPGEVLPVDEPKV